MKIEEAIGKIGLSKNTISSETAGMYGQTPETLSYWLLADDLSKDQDKVKTLKKILKATDWVFDDQDEMKMLDETLKLIDVTKYEY